MKFRSGLLAVAGVATLLLAGCSTAVEGSAQAAAPVNNLSGAPGDADDLGSLLGGLEGSDGSGNDDDLGDMGDLGALLDQLSDGSGDGDAGDMDNLGALLGGLDDGSGDGDAGDMGDLGALMGGLAGGLGGAAGLSDECVAVVSVEMQAGLLLMGPVMGGPGPTQQQVDDAFGNTENLPPELSAPIGLLHQAAEASIGKSGAEAMSILESNEFDSAMDALETYSDAHCDTE